MRVLREGGMIIRRAVFEKNLFTFWCGEVEIGGRPETNEEALREWVGRGNEICRKVPPSRVVV